MPMGGNSYEAAVAPDGNTAYVCGPSAGTVTPIQVAGDQADKPIALRWSCNQLVVTP
jgi:hypothetical protein